MPEIDDIAGVEVSALELKGCANFGAK